MPALGRPRSVELRRRMLPRSALLSLGRVVPVQACEVAAESRMPDVADGSDADDEAVMEAAGGSGSLRPRFDRVHADTRHRAVQRSVETGPRVHGVGGLLQCKLQDAAAAAIAPCHRGASRQKARHLGAGRYKPQRRAAVCTGESHSLSSGPSTAVTVIEQPDISSEVT